MGPLGHPKVVPWDQIFFLLESGLYMLAFGHMVREDFLKSPKTGKPGAHGRFWIRVIHIWLFGLLYPYTK